MRIDANAFEMPEKPEYVGDIDPEWAWQWESDFAGKSIGDIEELFRHRLRERFEEFRANVATVHDTSGTDHKSGTREEIV